jgi:hemin uptake protein HemP
VVTSQPFEPRETSGDPQPPPATPAREIDSQELMQGDREILIRHGAQVYRLSVTRSGKLILRK